MNSIEVSVSFSFQGEQHEPRAVIDLDLCSAEEGESPNFHMLLARAQGIDTYSYLYEVMEMSEIRFDHPVGLAGQCMEDGVFNWSCFDALRREQTFPKNLREIAREILMVDDLDGQPELKQALLAAYSAGHGKMSG